MCCRFRGSRITKVTRLQDAELSIVVANEPAALAIHCGDTDDDEVANFVRLGFIF